MKNIARNRIIGLVASAGVIAVVGIPIPAQASLLPVIDINDTQAYAPRIIASNDPANWRAPSGNPFDGVGKLILNRADGTFGCSGSLLDGGGFLVTAAHCLTDDDGSSILNSATVSFQDGAVTTTATQAHIWSGWDGHTLENNSDIAILRLDTPVTTISGFAIATGNPFLQPVLHAGYGQTGTGATGMQSGTFGALHYGYNVYDAVWTGGSLAYDFDDGTVAHDTFCIVAGLCNTGLPYPFESMIASGDSGGPSFILENGEFRLVGLHSFGATFGLGAGDIDAILNASFGEAGGDTWLLPHIGWIESITAVPEPRAYVLLITGLTVITAFARRQPRFIGL
ncbi:MAG: trypsin-like serine protease [Nitrosomonas sp.]|nr:trypsin-like serine protease [Nitrosomonas sp.]